MKRIALLLAFSFLAALPAVAQDAASSVPSITVRGDGTVRKAPDFARVVLTVETRSANLKQATDLHRVRATQILTMVEGMKDDGVSLQRSDFILNRDQERSGDASKTEPFVAETIFQIRLDQLAKFNKDVTALVGSGLVQIEGASFEIKDPAGAVNEARAAAIRAARVSAGAYAKAAGVQLGELEKILDVTPQSFPLLASAAMTARAASPPPLALEPPQTIAFHASVVATWRIGQR